MRYSTKKLTLFASTLFVLFLFTGNSFLGKGFFSFQKPAVNTGRDARPTINSYRIYIPQIDQKNYTVEQQPTATATAQPLQASVQLVSDPASNDIQDLPSDELQVKHAAAAAIANPVQPKPVAPEAQQISPALQNWIDQVKDGEAGVVRGLYVEGILALRVVQQPTNTWQYVSEEPETATQFQSASSEVTGLLAHNYLAGGLFFNLTEGKQIVVIYGDGQISRYKVTEIHSYQKLDEDNYYSPFIDQNTGEEMSSTEVFNHVYSGSKHLALQTCIEKDGDWSWGLLFIMAAPID